MYRGIGLQTVTFLYLALHVAAKKGEDYGDHPYSWGAGGGFGSGSGGVSGGSLGSGFANREAEFERAEAIVAAHGFMGAIAFAVLFPLGAIFIRAFSFRGLVWVHAAMQLFSYLIALAVMGLGLYIVMNAPFFSLHLAHPTIGLVVICGLVLQPFLGFLHHKLYASRGSPNFATRPHRWLGRLLIWLGIINGGLGLKLAEADRKWFIIYGVVAGIIWLVWFAFIVLNWLKPRRKNDKKSTETVKKEAKTSEEVPRPGSRRASSVERGNATV